MQTLMKIGYHIHMRYRLLFSTVHPYEPADICTALPVLPPANDLQKLQGENEALKAKVANRDDQLRQLNASFFEEEEKRQQVSAENKQLEERLLEVEAASTELREVRLGFQACDDPWV
jgi:septal ring factor EnvC (AmiA/AmiB activator)